MKMRLDHSFLTFTPAQAEYLTGVNVGLQRAWRFHGHMPKNEGHARYDLLSLCRLFILNALARKGIGPQHAAKAIDYAATAMAWHCLTEVNAYKDGDTLRSNFSIPRSAAYSETGEEFIPENPEPEWSWTPRAAWLANKIIYGRDFDDLPVSEAVVFEENEAVPDDPNFYVDHLIDQQAIKGVPISEMTAPGAIIIIPLASNARFLCLKAEDKNWPFVSVEIRGAK